MPKFSQLCNGKILNERIRAKNFIDAKKSSERHKHKIVGELYQAAEPVGKITYI